MYLENLSLRYQINVLKDEIADTRQMNVKNNDNLKNKTKVFNEIYKATNQYKGDISGNEAFFQKITQTQLLDKLKEKYKQVKENLYEKEREVESLKATMKITKINELEYQLRVYEAEIDRLQKIIRATDPKMLEMS